MLTESQAEEHMKVETEEAVDWIAPGMREVDDEEKEVEKLNGVYGY